MMWFFAILVVLVLGAVAVVASGKGTPMAQEYDDRPDASVPTGRPLTPHDLRTVRFSVALRGYRMSEVDALLARLADEREDASRGPAGDPVEGQDGPVDGPVDGLGEDPVDGPVHGTAHDVTHDAGHEGADQHGEARGVRHAE